jgi:flagellar biosynthesis regulator FlbT
LEGFGHLSLVGLLIYGSFLITNDIASPGLMASSIYALYNYIQIFIINIKNASRYVAIGFRSLINMYTELIKTAGIYDGLSKFSPNIHEDPVYNQIDFF